MGIQTGSSSLANGISTGTIPGIPCSHAVQISEQEKINAILTDCRAHTKMIVEITDRIDVMLGFADKSATISIKSSDPMYFQGAGAFNEVPAPAPAPSTLELVTCLRSLLGNLTEQLSRTASRIG